MSLISDFRRKEVADSIHIHILKVEETIKIGEIIGSLLEPGSLVALKGELGAGKTVIVKGIAKGLKVEDEPNSPTFVIMNVHEGRIPLYHFDLYRVSDIDELEGIGYEDYFFGDGVSVIEWAERIDNILSEETIKIEITISDKQNADSEGERYIKIEGNEKWLSLFRSMVERALPASIK
ncbi:MAG: tRNA (adenosine(37)-N6)-threonylcarbamoyltransferase complex ATPase subunit type 1 TsaE [Thermodesulfobacteriota bacterium]